MDIRFAPFFQLLSDETRLRSLALLTREGELCVCELVHALGEIQPKISRHLAALRDAGIVIDRRQGQWVYYAINPELPGWARRVIDATIEEASRHEIFIGDHSALMDMPNRPTASRCA